MVLHGGATAVFRVASLEEAPALAEAIAQAPDLERSGVLMTVASDRLTVRLTRGVFRLEPHHVGLASAVSDVARNRGAVADRGAVHEVQLAIAAKPDAADVDFWRAVLGYSPLADDNAIDPLGHGSTVWMQELDPNKELRHAMHVDVSLAREHAEARVAAALAAGCRIVDESDAPEGWISRGPRREQGLHRRLARRRSAARLARSLSTTPGPRGRSSISRPFALLRIRHCQAVRNPRARRP